jgi:hypothetical protein
VPKMLAKFVREPLVHFVTVGAGLFAAWHYFGEPLSAQPDRIVITPGQVERIAQHWSKTHLRPPTAQELAGLVDQEIDEEILYREAVAMGLDRDDLVIRRRLAVKMEFVTDDLVGELQPTDDELQAFLREHPEKFNVDPLTTFSQIFVDRTRRGEDANVRIDRILAQLDAKPNADWETLGDPLPLPNKLTAANSAEIVRLFGREFSKKLEKLPIGRWTGPVESGFGLHVVLVGERTGGRIPHLDKVRDEVTTEWRNAQRQRLTESIRQQRRAKYSVTIQWPDWAQK